MLGSFADEIDSDGALHFIAVVSNFLSLPSLGHFSLSDSIGIVSVMDVEYVVGMIKIRLSKI